MATYCYRSPTRCTGGGSPESRRTPRLGKRPIVSAGAYQAIASAASRACSSSGKETDERPLEGALKPGQDERERRLRDTSRLREGVDERAEALARCELVDEAVKWRRVHASGGNGVPRGHPSPPSHDRFGRRAAWGYPARKKRHGPRENANDPQGHPRCPTDTVSTFPSHGGRVFAPIRCR